MNYAKETLEELVPKVRDLVCAQWVHFPTFSMVRDVLMFGRTTPQAISFARAIIGSKDASTLIEFLKEEEEPKQTEQEREDSFFQEFKDATRLYCKLYDKVLPLDVIDDIARTAAQNAMGQIEWEYQTRNEA